MLPSVKKLLQLIEAFMASNIYETAAPAKSTLRDDVTRLHVLLQVGCLESIEDFQKADQADAAKSGLVKGKGSFQSALTVYPVGAFLCDKVSKMITQSRVDRTLVAEMKAAAEFAQNLKVINRDAIMKEKEGDWDLAIPQQNKFADMVSKLVHFKENASEAAKKSSSSDLEEITDRVNQLRSSLLEAAAVKLDKKFPTFPNLIEELADHKIVDTKVTECLQVFGEIVAYQPLQRVPLAKLLGKELAAEVEVKLGSIVSVCRHLQGALSKVCSLSQPEMQESVLLQDQLTSLVSFFKDEEHMRNLADVLPEWEASLSKLKESIEKSVAALMKRTTATFHGFVLKLLEPEVDLNAILQTGIVGALEADSSDDKDSSHILHVLDSVLSVLNLRPWNLSMKFPIFPLLFFLSRYHIISPILIHMTHVNKLVISCQ